MNTTASPSPSSCSRPDRPEREPSRREPHHPTREAFERALLSKKQPPAADEDDDKTPGSDTGAAAAPGFAASPPVRSAMLGAQPVGARGVEPASSGTRAAIETALAHHGPASTPVAGTAPATVWEASIGERLGLPVEVRAVRAERGAHEAQAAWGLSVRSSALGGETLARHASRLHERLRKHGIETTHVRVEADPEDDRRG